MSTGDKFFFLPLKITEILVILSMGFEEFRGFLVISHYFRELLGDKLKLVTRFA